MTKEIDTLGLSYTTNKVAALEVHVGRSISEIIAELQSEKGASLATLRAAVAAGRIRFPDALIGHIAVQMELGDAGRLIDEYGTAVVGSAVGAQLGDFLRTLSAEREAA
ncbi:MAG: hypothetical protein JNK47_02820 [Mesorhizobium sp.]|nr:hypothetical protein [Mesorhizobium sp.]MBL8576133.1 hypothetical protein [Mesorhizobium sp.]